MELSRAEPTTEGLPTFRKRLEEAFSRLRKWMPRSLAPQRTGGVLAAAFIEYYQPFHHPN